MLRIEASSSPVTGFGSASNVVGVGAVSNASTGAKAGPSGATAASTCALVAEGPSAFSAASTLEELAPGWSQRPEVFLGKLSGGCLYGGWAELHRGGGSGRRPTVEHKGPQKCEQGQARPTARGQLRAKPLERRMCMAP